MSSKDLEESILDFASQATADLQEAIALVSNDDQKNALVLEHIKKVCSQGKTIFEPNESAEWAWGLQNVSLQGHCEGRVSLLDFFTYCCINCQQVLPDIKDLESVYSPNDGFLVVGVHSAKFDAERDPDSVQKAAKRMNITHPVLNDPQAVLWTRLGIHCWPTLLLLCPEGKPIIVLAGEGHRDFLFRCVSVVMTYFKETNSLKSFTGEFAKPSKLAKEVNYLSYPGKVCLNTFVDREADKPYLTISDSSNNRILIADGNLQIIHIVGGPEAGFKDGPFKMAKFDNPQGMCWLDSETLVVCDTGNHSIRKVCLNTSTVDLLAGTGLQTEFGDQGGLKYCQQALASPWDVVLYKTPDMDLSVRSPLSKKDDKAAKDAKDKKDAESSNDDYRRVLLIAVAGCHQIWALFLDTTVWWRYRTFSEGTLIPIVGSGREENRNNRYPNAAGLAQPSGLALKNNLLYIADSESSTIRKLDLSSGQLYALVGGDRNPCNLFAYGDLDGTGINVRLQHPLGITCCPKTSSVYIADTYNHKIKLINTLLTDCNTFYPKDIANTKIVLSEPGGLCITPDSSTMYIADTNSNRIVSLNMQTEEAEVVKLVFPDMKKTGRSHDDYKDKDLLISPSLIPVRSSKGSKLIIDFNVSVLKNDKNMYFTHQAPQRWYAKFLTAKDKKTDIIGDWEIKGCIRSGREIPGHFEATLKSSHPDCEKILRIEFVLSLCEGGLCFMKRFATDLILGLKSDGPPVSKHNLNIVVNPNQTVGLKIASYNTMP